MDFSIPAFWLYMGLVIWATLGVAIVAAIKRRRALKVYWDRYCTGRKWRKKFPDAPKEEIRAFLGVFVRSFGFSQKRRCAFAPEDKVMEVYRAVYPSGWAVADGLELESLALDLERKYGVQAFERWKEAGDVTLGELFQWTREKRG
jgi:propanediol dehydratase small subunit